MRELTFVKPGQLEFRERPAPRIEAGGEALVRPLAVARCDLDLAFAHGKLPAQGPFGLGATDAIGAEICEIEPDAFRQRLARARGKLRPLLEERCGLVDAARPCRCSRQVIAKQRVGMRLPIYDDATGERVHEQLGSLRRLGHVLAVDPPPEPRATLWAKLAARFPDLLGPTS